MLRTLFWLLTLASFPCQAALFSVTFINPGKSSEKFWLAVSESMRAAARTLDVQLEVRYAERDHLKAIELAREVAARPLRPDYLVVVNEKQAAGEMIRIADRVGLKTFLLLNRFEDAQAAEFGPPRQKYRHWIGSLTPDNEDAGARTATALLARARQGLPPGTPVQVLAIAGDKTTPASVQRLAGLQRALAAQADARLMQTVHGNWEQDKAREQTALLLQRHPGVRAIWAANDLMAFGAMDAARAAGRKPGEDIFFSAINSAPEALAAVADGRLAALAAGHFLAGGWALVMLHDYHRGHDFADEGLEPRARMFGLIDPANLPRFRARLGDEQLAGLDFRPYSKVLQPRLTRYAFELDPLLRP